MIDSIIERFVKLIGCDWRPSDEQLSTLEQLICFAINNGYGCSNGYEESFYEAVNQKLALNQQAYQKILDVAFYNSIKLNYLIKTEIRQSLDRSDKDQYIALLKNNDIMCEAMITAFEPVQKDETRRCFEEAKQHDPQFQDMLYALFARYSFNLFDKRCTYVFFSGRDQYQPDYFDFISSVYPDMCKRDSALAFIDVSSDIFEEGYEHGCNMLMRTVQEAYTELNNHCDMIVYIPNISICGHSIQWELFSDIVLYAEKMNQGTIDKMYFRWKKIKQITEEYIPSIKDQEVDFSIAFQGFAYKDCFIVADAKDYSLLLVFEKNERDERILYCPACRSINVGGNSYPILNVRSWECQNALCPDRSKYNRGKRYAFSSIMRQRLMADESNRIPEQSIAAWHLDCVFQMQKSDAFEMALRHYSCTNDGVVIYATNQPDYILATHQRSIIVKPFCSVKADSIRKRFIDSLYFRRYIQIDPRTQQDPEEWTFNKATVMRGDAYEVLQTLPDDSIDGAVTSPPYYNAKEYSQWPNIYCYLYDMYNITLELFRVLKPGAVYLFNVFDYFDNERNIVFSAMGDKRMILGAYLIDIFRRVGFTIQGNIIWYKGEIQGNRSFNQGNLTPYYQAPLNCWEHIFVLSKGEPAKPYQHLRSYIAPIRPVIKMVHGKNTLGHTAPYPIEIPDILLDCMSENDIILDPFLGSGTTCIAANHHGVRSIGIEKNSEYFELCKKLIHEKSDYQLSFIL